MAHFSKSLAAKSNSAPQLPLALYSRAPMCGLRVGASTSEWKSMIQAEERLANCDQKQCPRCTTVMFLERELPKFGPLPELRTYKCPECRCMVEDEIGPGGRRLFTRRIVEGLPDYFGSKHQRVLSRF